MCIIVGKKKIKKMIDERLEKNLDDLFDRQFEKQMGKWNIAETLAEIEEHMRSIDQRSVTFRERMGALEEKYASGRDKGAQASQPYDAVLRDYGERLGKLEGNGCFVSIEDVREEIRKEIGKETGKEIGKEAARPDTDKLRQEISASLIPGIQENIKNMVEQTSGSYIRRLQLDNQNAAAQIQALGRALESEKEQNNKLFQIVRQQSEDIRSLAGRLQEMQQCMGQWRETSATAAQEQPPARKPELKAAEKPQEPAPYSSLSEAQSSRETVSGSIQTAVVFDEDNKKNKKALERFIRQAEKVSSRVALSFENPEDSGIYMKLIDKCIKKFQILLEKYEEKEYGADKLANESAKILKQTIIRGLSQKLLKQIMDDYMAACGVRKLNWSIGQVIADEDYEYLGEPVFYKEVFDRAWNGAVTGIQQDTYIIDYMEDDNRYEAIMPGIYEIGKYKNS